MVLKNSLGIYLQDVKWLQTITSMPILVKGVITAEDSKQPIHVYFICGLSCSLSIFFENIRRSRNVFVQNYLCDNAARLAIQAGAAGIIVSNHGARQLDYVPATITALEEVKLSSICM